MSDTNGDFTFVLHGGRGSLGGTRRHGWALMNMASSLKLVPAQTKSIPGVVVSAAYAGGRRVSDISIEEAGDWSRKPGHVVWIGLHELAIEDALKAHQRPKLEQYGEALFIVARTAQMLNGRIAFGETHLFVGNGYVVSVRHGASITYTLVRERCEAAPHALSADETSSSMPFLTSSSTTTCR